jgi:2-keto-4-pentenoate hydratase
MTPEAIAKAASELVSARRQGKPLAGLPDGCRPASPEEGYAVQSAFISSWSDSVAGWKAGATAVPVQQKFGLDQPFLGPVFASTVMMSPATVSATVYDLRTPAAGAKRSVAVEVEFAFRLGRDLAPRSGGYSEAEVLDAVEAMVPAIEIITPRFESIPFGSAGEALADCGLNGGIVLGTPIADWRGIDFPAHATSLVVDGKTVVEGTGALVLGNPLKSLVWLVNGAGRLGHALARGQVLTTGSMTGIYHVELGSLAVGDFGRFGKVEARIA